MKAYECKLFIGSVRGGYDGLAFSLDDLKYEIRYQQSIDQTSGPVRITETTYVYLDYEEPGWEITIIQYPRFPKPEHELRAFMLRMGAHLLEVFDQNRVTVQDGEKVTMLEAPNAQENPGEHRS